MTDTAPGVPAPSRGRYLNTGNGPTLQPLDIGHPDYVALVEPDTAFWALVRKGRLAEAMRTGGSLMAAYRRHRGKFQKEMDTLRFGLKPTAVYFNPTERCNLNCTYCYIPKDMRQKGSHMPEHQLLKALEILKSYFDRTVPEARPQIVFHGAEPLLNKDAVFSGIAKYKRDFIFGVQTNATLLDDEGLRFLKDHNVSIGISLDAPAAAVADRTRKNWHGRGVFESTMRAMERLRGYENYSVICTVTSENMRHLTKLVDLLHGMEAPACLMNVVRCTLKPSRAIKPDDAPAARHFIAALDRTYELYRQTGRKLPVANFANILLAIIAPSARRLMCDISPCGGGRCFFALTPSGDLFPCSEFIGLGKFKGGNIFRSDLGAVLASKAFGMVTGRKVEDIVPCNRCAIRHFCGSPCPAEAHEMNGGMHRTGAFCEFYEEQARYAFRLIADDRHEAYLWDGWDRGARDVFSLDALDAAGRPRQ